MPRCASSMEPTPTLTPIHYPISVMRRICAAYVLRMWCSLYVYASTENVYVYARISVCIRVRVVSYE